MDCIRMDKNEFIPCWPEDWFRDFIPRLRPEHLSVHPELGPLYEGIERVLGFKRDKVTVTAGSDAAIRSAFEVFVDPGDEVVILSPTYAMYYIYARIYKASLVEVHYEEGPRLDTECLLDALSPRTKLVAIANPNSPTGTVIEQDDLDRLIKRASELGAAVLVDEAYYPFYEGNMADSVDLFDNLIVTRTFSKAAGLAGMRVGFAFSNSRITGMLFAVKPMYEITTIAALLAEYVLENYERVFEYARLTREGKEYLADYFRLKGYEVYPGFANFIHVDLGERKEKIVSFLKKRRVLFKETFDMPGLRHFSRFTVGPKESLHPVIDIFEQVL